MGTICETSEGSAVPASCSEILPYARDAAGPHTSIARGNRADRCRP
jgi:hypothetical protein